MSPQLPDRNIKVRGEEIKPNTFCRSDGFERCILNFFWFHAAAHFRIRMASKPGGHRLRSNYHCDSCLPPNSGLICKPTLARTSSKLAISVLLGICRSGRLESHSEGSLSVQSTGRYFTVRIIRCQQFDHEKRYPTTSLDIAMTIFREIHDARELTVLGDHKLL